MRTATLLFLLSLVCLSQQDAPPTGGPGGGPGGRGGDPLSTATFNALRFRALGPASASGRVTSIAMHPRNPAHYFIGVASGGVWKTTNNGITWTPVFDNEGSYSIGTVVLDPKNPSTVWVGTGENNSQRSVSYGDGIYRSDDGGRTWRNLGLKTSEHIARIVIDPRDSNVVFVASQGPLWAPGGERGVFKTTDGGKTWKNVLKISENTGVTDIVQDPTNPDTLIAASYQRRRHQWTLIDGGPESAIYKSDDAGEHWRRVRSGLPQGEMGRIGLTYSPAQAKLLYAKIEAANNQSAIYRSADGGESWERRAAFEGIPMYYGQIVADPKDPEKFYFGDTNMRVSDDGGRTLRVLGDRNKHVDSHTIWIDPQHTDHLLVGCDGGVYESYDGGQFWEYKPNLPTLQFYDVEVDNSKPYYYIYGGTQDNASLGGPSRNRSANGIPNSDWFVTTGGDGFVSRIDPEDVNTVYSESQNGGLVRFDRRTGSRIPIRPIEGKGEAALRWNWDAPLIISPHSHTRLYFGANKLFRSDDRGSSWRAISGDLTRQLDRNALPVMGKIWGPEAVAKNASTAFYGNLAQISESPKRAGLIYVGTDDGLIQVLDDEGAQWRKAGLPAGVPENTVVQRLNASVNDENTVYAAFDNHQNGDFKPYFYKSADRGKTWKSISGNLPANGPVMSFAEDHVNPNLLFAGTEYGVFFTIDGGEKWIRLRGGLPTIQVRDMAIQRRESDLVLGTFGRGFYVLDDYSPLRLIKPETLKEEAVVFPVKPAVEFVQSSPLGGRGKGSQGESYYAAENPPFGAIFTIYVRDASRTRAQIRRAAEIAADRNKEPIKYPTNEELRAESEEEAPAIIVTITDANGKLVRRLNAAAAPGMQRVVWDLRGTSPVVATAPAAIPGGGGGGGGGRGGRGGGGGGGGGDLEGGGGGGGGDEGGFGGGGFGGGNFVPPGKYKVALAKRAGGRTMALGNTQEFVVSSEAGAHPTEFLDKIGRLQGAVQAATETANATRQKFATIRRAIADSASADKLREGLDSMEKRLDAILRALTGDAFLRRRQENTPPSIQQRVQSVSGAMRGQLEPPTKTQQEQYAIALAEFEVELPKLRALVDVDVKKYEKELDAAKIPPTPGRLPNP